MIKHCLLCCGDRYKCNDLIGDPCSLAPSTQNIELLLLLSSVISFAVKVNGLQWNGLGDNLQATIKFTPGNLRMRMQMFGTEQFQSNEIAFGVVRDFAAKRFIAGTSSYVQGKLNHFIDCICQPDP